MEFISGLLNIVVIDLVLSGDNAVVIGMAAHRLEPRQRKVAILSGAAAAIVLRVVLTAVAALLLAIPVLRLVGGLLLVWIAFKLLAEEDTPGGVKVARTLRGAITTILVADFIMSADNVLGVAAASRGDMGLLVFGLVTSMAILMFLGGLVAAVIDRFWWLAYLGSAVIAWTGASLALDDAAVERIAGPVSTTVAWAVATAVALVTLAFAHWFHRVRGESATPAESAQSP